MFCQQGRMFLYNAGKAGLTYKSQQSCNTTRLLVSWIMMCDKIISQNIEKTFFNGSRIAGKIGEICFA